MSNFELQHRLLQARLARLEEPPPDPECPAPVPDVSVPAPRPPEDLDRGWRPVRELSAAEALGLNLLHD